jgi:hypothetical protein
MLVSDTHEARQMAWAHEIKTIAPGRDQPSVRIDPGIS